MFNKKSKKRSKDFADIRRGSSGSQRSTCLQDSSDMLNPLNLLSPLSPLKRLIPLSQVNQNLGLAGQIRNGAGFDFFGKS